MHIVSLLNTFLRRMIVFKIEPILEENENRIALRRVSRRTILRRKGQVGEIVL